MTNQDEPETLHTVAAAYVELDSEIKAAKARVKELEAKKTIMADFLQDGMIIEGAPSVVVTTSSGKATVYPMSQIWARRSPDADMQVFLSRLRQAGLGQLVSETVSTSSLSAWVREQAEEHGVKGAGSKRITDALPEYLQSVLTVTTTPTLAVRRTKN
tara:strand:- start:2647 stop:3120 length:474 start_codon:yes stop_codon:yes gene_type:complete